MGISDLEKLKKLSWYTTVPLLVFAWVIQDKAYLDPTFFTFFGGLNVIGTYFTKIVVALFVAFVVWIELVSRMGNADKVFTLLFATFILTIAGVGVGLNLLNPTGTQPPFNIYWFIALGSIAFNLYEMLEANIKAEEKLRNAPETSVQ
ncbi:hypothetical protein BOO22_21360 [Vibrio cidicii]|nr:MULTISPECIES: hypothetical protein [Vibrio]EKO3440529.1 hypothetical protein [Vibrio fluvialis]HDY7987121.1 hypothetical protein [Vibrio vulnificus]EIQ1513582.1 hypothetical protein [Vibrio parahaemolyticus]EJT1886902.1 hypothetical protein [Vibrio parahaemolyticus]ELB2775178.1 hypothetical protein [Vibrio parahaemolyticus]